MRIAIVGTGYVGLVSGACFAEFGHEVVCVDQNVAKIEGLRRGVMPIYEPGLDALVAANVAAGRLSFETALKPAAAAADAIFIAVGTPPRASDGHADLSYVYAVAREIGEVVDRPVVVVTKSTVPVGTGDQVERLIRDANPQAAVQVVSNPEFLREGIAIEDFLSPDRVVIGTMDSRARAVMAEIYRPLEPKGVPIVYTDRRTSELTKYAANAFLAIKIAFINEIADLCERVNGDVREVAKGIGLDSRIGAKFLQAGPGYGGSCFPKDTLALLKTAEDHDTRLSLVEASARGNDLRKRAMGRKVIRALGGTVRDTKIAVLGLTFKPDTDDMRGAPSVSLIQALKDGGAQIAAWDPAGEEQARPMLPDVAFVADPYAACEAADAAVIVTEWDALKELDLARLAGLLKRRVLIDLRNVHDAAAAESAGLTYFAIGRGDHSVERVPDER